MRVTGIELIIIGVDLALLVNPGKRFSFSDIRRGDTEADRVPGQAVPFQPDDRLFRSGRCRCRFDRFGIR